MAVHPTVFSRMLESVMQYADSLHGLDRSQNAENIVDQWLSRQGQWQNLWDTDMTNGQKEAFLKEIANRLHD